MNMSKNMQSEEFEYVIQECGNSAHIRMSKKWLGKKVKVKVQEVTDAVDTSKW
jgi:putative transposon-encoded protein